MTLYEIEVLAHHWFSYIPFPRADAPLYPPTINKFVAKGMMRIAPNGVPRLTRKGAAFIRVLEGIQIPDWPSDWFAEDAA